MPFGDDEDIIGASVQRVAEHLQRCGLEFELLAVDEDSGDNSQAVLTLVRSRHGVLQQALSILKTRPRSLPTRSRRGYELGARRAGGRVVWLLSARAALGPFDDFDAAYAEVAAGACDLVETPRFIVAERLRCRTVFPGVAGRGPRYRRRLVQRAQTRGLAVSTAGARPRPRSSWVWRRLLAVRGSDGLG
ncbi:hypothetical protein Hoch_5068 [Haliangium ochraceum DSM 14365]|uniref:Glycosyltransferase 2-like domain-containing protein n=2 Tax=Haliangium ochraceum TaxID=80816 RepID=D0LVJ5_HALO1|nr:hypothetical protein Hoch_5068 [Haliangium ochraceum DSM 14365]